MKPLHRSFAAETKILSEADRTCEFVASDQTLDCYGEIVRAAGWKFERFAQNAPFVDSHNYASVGFLLGNVTQASIAGGRLVEQVKFVPEGLSPLADFAWKMIAAKFLKAVSVGFLPIRIRSRWRDEGDFADAVKELGLAADVVAKLNCIHWEQDQTELSSVLIGANPSAVALAHKSGAVADEDLAGIGFKDADDISFLHDAAKGWDGADAPLRRRIRAELRAIVAPTILSASGNQPAGTIARATFSTNSQSTPPAKTREAAGEQDAHARQALLADLTRLEASGAQAARATGGNSKP